MPTISFWWQINLDKKEKKACLGWQKKLTRIQFNKTAQKKADNIIIQKFTRLLKKNAKRLIEDKSLSILCHLLNGLGNGLYYDKKLVSYLDNFVVINSSGAASLIQNPRGGETHPWQTFAYAFMAGIKPTAILSDQDYTLQSLAKNSCNIAKVSAKGSELGHLLFSIAHLPSSFHRLKFNYGRKIKSVRELFQAALDAHQYSLELVCDMFHLTEGLCAASAKIPFLKTEKILVGQLLNKQLSQLIPLSLFIHHAAPHFPHQKTFAKHSIPGQLAAALNLTGDLNRFFFCAGHLIELLCFSASFGFTIKPHYWRAAFYIMNELNTLLYQQGQTFLIDFGALAHYRRANTLLLLILPQLKNQRIILTAAQLKQYTIKKMI